MSNTQSCWLRACDARAFFLPASRSSRTSGHRVVKHIRSWGRQEHHRCVRTCYASSCSRRCITSPSASLEEASAALRSGVVAALREAMACDAGAGVGTGAGADEAVRAEVDLLLGEAQRCTAQDDTSVRLRAALQPLLAVGCTLGTPGAREAYLDVMGRV